MPPASVVVDDIDAGRLVRLPPDYLAPNLPLHAVTLPDGNTIPKVSRFLEMLVARLS